jgi:predicted nucleic acid-binding protein
LVAYLDSSALVKLVVDEPESDALRDELTGWIAQASSDIARVELRRAVRRRGREQSRRLEQARRLFGGIELMYITDAILDAAAELDPPALRSLDALHLASALALRERLGVLISYDKRMLGAAAEVGLTTSAPA